MVDTAEISPVSERLTPQTLRKMGKTLTETPCPEVDILNVVDPKFIHTPNIPTGDLPASFIKDLETATVQYEEGLRKKKVVIIHDVYGEPDVHDSTCPHCHQNLRSIEFGYTRVKEPDQIAIVRWGKGRIATRVSGPSIGLELNNFELHALKEHGTSARAAEIHRFLYDPVPDLEKAK